MNDATRMKMMKQREIFKGHSVGDVNAEPTDEEQGIVQPPVAQAMRSEEWVSLTREFEGVCKKTDILDILESRRSRRAFTQEMLTMEELSFLLWTTQGIKKVIGKVKKASMRMVPSAGARHPFETYLFIRMVEGLKPGLYHYAALEHALEYVKPMQHQEEELSKALCDQEFAGQAPVTFVWSVIPYRAEWRYGMKAHKYALIDAGHVCENLYLAGEAVGCGVCAIGAYDQELIDELMGFGPGPSCETDYECTVYAAAVGKVKQKV